MPVWIVRVAATRAEAEAAMAAEEPFPGEEPPPALSATEGGDCWELAIHLEAAPDPRLLAALAALAPSAVCLPRVEELPDTDWVTRSQAALAPVDAGRFHVHTRTTAGRARPGQIALRIEAGQAFGTGQHATTRGCLLALDSARRRGRLGRVLDLGTGSGVLAIAAARADRKARILATDIDPVAIRTARANAQVNRAREIRCGVARGLFSPLILRAAPFDLVLANILAGPLVALAPGLAQTIRPGGQLVLAGMLEGQTRAVAAAYRARGFALQHRIAGAWPILVLRRRGSPRRSSRGAAVRAARRGTGAALRGAGTI